MSGGLALARLRLDRRWPKCRRCRSGRNNLRSRCTAHPGPRTGNRRLARQRKPNATKNTDLNRPSLELKSIKDTVEVRYLDAGLARQTYNCTVDAL